MADPTYIHNWPLQPFSQDYVVCVNFIHKWRDLQLKSTPNDRFFENLFMAIFIDSQSFCQKSAERRKSPKKYFSYFVVMSGLGLEPWLFV